MFITESQHWLLHSYSRTTANRNIPPHLTAAQNWNVSPVRRLCTFLTSHVTDRIMCITITLGTIITACPRWQDDLMDLNGGWSPSFISEYEHEFARVLVSYCTHLRACPADCDEPGSTPHRRVCALAAVSCLWGAVDQNVRKDRNLVTISLLFLARLHRHLFQWAAVHLSHHHRDKPAKTLIIW